jgi:hypothetical protein
MKLRKDFLGLDGFYWWFGVVESRKDPLGLGRCQVRIFGAHSESLSDIPSEDLPWAQPVHSLNNQAFSTPKEGEYVFGFFLDGKYAQSPVMMGIVPGIPQEATDPNSGFADHRSAEDIASSPKKPQTLEFATDGTGVSITEIQDETELAALRFPAEKQLTHPTNSNLVRNQNVTETLIQDRRKNLVSVEGANGTTWDEPFPAYSAVYPYNKALETESGHIMEFDDTPGSERIHIAHRSGSFQEYYPSGTKVEKIVKNNYKLVLADDHVYVSGRVNITIESDANIKVVGNVNLDAMNDLNFNVAGDINMAAAGDIKMKGTAVKFESSDSFDIKSASSVAISGSSSASIQSDGSVILGGSSVEITSPLNVSGATNLTVTGNTALASGPGSHLHQIVKQPVAGSGAASASAATVSGLSASLSRGEPNNADPYIEQTPADKAAVLFDGGEEGVDEYIKEQIDKGFFTQAQIDAGKTPTEGDSNSDKPPETPPTTNSCAGIENLTAFPNSLQLSTHFTLGALTGQAPCGDPLIDQRGLTKGQIACNLKLLAINALDLIKAKYPSMTVTNAFRKPVGAAAGRSQHEIGQAADMQFPGYAKNQYYDIVLWIRDNVPHDQLLLEYKTTGTGNPWIHISFNKDGNRPAGPTKNMTFMNQKSYKPFYVNLA